MMTYASSPTMLILGDMAELGDISLQEHGDLVAWIDSLAVDRVLLVGPRFYKVCEPSSARTVFRDREELNTTWRRKNPGGTWCW
jgi:UDP-N-acetylmuramyl pentapeptide synthase